MNSKSLILKEIKQIPDPLLDEALDFIWFLKSKIIKKQKDITVLSESSLKKDWLKVEDNKAWKNL